MEQNNDPLKIVITGATGRMGQTLIRLISQREDMVVHAALIPEGDAKEGESVAKDIAGAPENLIYSSNPVEALQYADAMIDFSLPEGSVIYAGIAAQARTVHVIGTTGFTKQQNDQIIAASRHATIIKSGNMSMGIHLLAHLVKQAASTLDDNFDIEVIEYHHNQKRDAPSGTALILGQAAADGRGIELEKHADLDRHSEKKVRKQGDIGFATVRAGSIIGEHTVMFGGPSERLELTHKAESRDVFAEGAIKAALWGINHARENHPGLFGMEDVLGLGVPK